MRPSALLQDEIDARLLPQPVQTGRIQIDEMWHGLGVLIGESMLALVQSDAGVRMVPGSFAA